MPQRVSQKPSVVLNKGLITEAGELTFPEGVSVDELNFSLERDGSRRRRLGIAYESNYQTFGAVNASTISSQHVWANAGSSAGLDIIVVQLDGVLHFFKESSSALSASKYPATINLTDFNRPSGFGAATVPIQATVLEGRLFVASSEINSFYITFDDSTETFSTEVINFRVRDFIFQGDITTYSEPSVYKSNVLEDHKTNDPERYYDTINSSWAGDKGTAALETYVASEESMPPLNLPWYVGKDANGNFSVADFKEIYAGTSLVANGGNILNLYEKEREGLTTEIETTRFKTVVSYAGRVFYAGMSNSNSNKVFFSSLAYQGTGLGDCYQVNDPTSEDFSDLLDTDGGVIVIPEAYNIQRLHVLGPYLIVLAENGVWSVNGVDNVFRATGFATDKVSEAGIQVSDSFVSAEGRPYWWSNVGIHTVQVTEKGLLEQNISLPTIQTFWRDIGADKRDKVKGAFDRFNKRISWFYPADTTGLDGVLTFDESLGAFYPWKISVPEGTTPPRILAPGFVEGNRTDGVTFNVVDSSGNFVVDSLGNQVVVAKDSRTFGVSQLNMLVSIGEEATFAEFSDTTFKDWGTASYQSFVETPYDFSGDLSRKKRLIYVNVYSKVTEEGFEDNGDGSFSYIRPSSCLVSTYWDFKTNPSTPSQQAYRIKEIPIVEDLTLTPPYTVTNTRLRLRGRGSSLRFRFESEEGKDMHLLGFDTIVGANPR